MLYFFVIFKKAIDKLTSIDMIQLNIYQHQIENNEQKDTEWIIWRGRRQDITGMILIIFFPRHVVLRIWQYMWS